MNVMQRLLSVFIVLVVVSVSGFAFETVLEEIDDLASQERYNQVRSRLDDAERTARTSRDRAEVAWRRARLELVLVDRDRAAERASDSELIERLEQGEEYARQAIDYDPGLAEGHFWMAANKGRRGQLRGVLNSLFMASDVRDYAQAAIARDESLAAAYHLLGILYRELPGGIISFGDDQRAVSLGRQAVDLQRSAFDAGDADEIFHQYRTELAQSLWERNWNQRRRGRNHSSLVQEYRSASTPLERAFSYEGANPIVSGTDREEARDTLRGVIDELEAIASRSQLQQDNLSEAREIWDDWN